MNASRPSRFLFGLLVALIATSALGVGLATATSSGKQSGAERAADIVLRNGFVYTVVPRSPHSWDWQRADHKPQRRADKVAQALAIRNGRIVYVGTNRGVRRFVGPKTTVTNLHGRMVMPGLEDGHIHPLAGGASLTSCSLEYLPLTVAQVLDRIGDCLQQTSDSEPDGWLPVQAFNIQGLQPAGAELTAKELDTLSTKRPIVVSSADGHASIANSRALALAGITSTTPDPADGHIEKDPSGQPTGRLDDGAQRLVEGKIPPKTLAEKVDDLKAAQSALLEQGVTTIMDAASGADELRVFRALQRRGGLDLRTYHAVLLDVEESANPAAAVKRVNGVEKRFERGRIGIDTVKIFGDGIKEFPAQTGALLEPYLVNAGTAENPNWVPGTYAGSLYWSQKQLNSTVAAFDKAGWQVHEHCVGDLCTRTSLNAFAYARKRNGRTGNRHTIAHIDLAHPDDYPRFHKLGVLGSMSLQWGKRDPQSVEGDENFLGPERMARMYPLGDLVRHDAVVGAGSDWPVDPLDEWFAVEIGVTRTNDRGDEHYNYLLNKEGVPVEQMLRLNTVNSAYQLHNEKKLGTLETGKWADLIVLNQNVLRVPVKRISETKVLTTMISGKVVYQRR